MHHFSFLVLCVVVLLLAFAARHPWGALGIFISLFYLPVRRVLYRLGGPDEKKARRKADEFKAKLSPAVLFLVRLLAFRSLWGLRLLQWLLGIDKQAVERATRHLEDFDRFLGLDR